MEGKYGKLLTVLLIVAVVAVLGLLGYLGYDVYKTYLADKEAQGALEQFDNQVANKSIENEISNTDLIAPTADSNVILNGSGGGSVKYKNIAVVGKIAIPKIDIEYPVLEKTTTAGLKSAITIIYGPGLNQVGNTVLLGHNYRNGTYFSNLKKLSIGDSIYITDISGTKLQYKIYNKYTTEDSDADYMTRNTEGRKEISLSTCTDDVKTRLVIWAKAE